MWTGDSVCHDITLEGQEWVNKRIKRPSYVWWNFPVTDYCRSNLCMGRVYGLPQESGSRESMSGLVSNPMDKPEASKVTLFGIADYAWNINGFKSDEAWKEGIVRLYPQAAEAMQAFVDHNSDQGPNGARLPARGIREHSPRGHPRAGSRPGGQGGEIGHSPAQKGILPHGRRRSRHTGKGGQPAPHEGNWRLGGRL